MERKLNKRYPFQIWQITTLIFPTVYVLYRLMDWRKEQFSVLGVFYLLLLAVLIGGVLSLPSLALSRFAGRSVAQAVSRNRLARLRTVLCSVMAMFTTLTLITIFLYPLRHHYWVVGTFYTVCVTITSFLFEPLEKEKKVQPILRDHQNALVRFHFS